MALVAVPTLALAITNDFTVTQQIGSDTTPPTVPTALVTTPVATTQIDLTWGASTDVDSSVAGYQVFRDSVQIATTTLLSYSDTGLSASTSYDYNVSAYDLFFNISGRSATSSTTTLPIVATTTPTTTPTSGGGGSQNELRPIDLAIEGVQVEVTDTTAVISFETSAYAVSSVRYGLSPQYELGSTASDIYRQQHLSKLSSLESGSRYYFEIMVSNQRGDVASYKSDFITQSIEDLVPPENVARFRAKIEGDDVLLDWDIPAANDFDRVRIIANRQFYPNDIADGLIVYDGRGESYRQVGVYPEHDRMYYTAFALDTNGNQSSGAIASVTWVEESETSVATSTIVATSSSEEIAELSFSNLEFIQNSKIRHGYQSLIDLDPNRPFTIRLPYDSVPEHLKTITITLKDPSDSSLTFAFLLRINKVKSHYEATIGALGRQGKYPLHFSFLDFKTKEIASFDGVVSTVFKSEQAYPEPKRTLVEHLLFIASRYWWCWLLVLILLYMAYRLMTEERPTKENVLE